MIYSISTYLKSLSILGFLSIIMFIIDTKLKNVDYLNNLDILYFIIVTFFISFSLYFVTNLKSILLPYSLNFHSIFSHNTIIESRNKRSLFLDFFWNKKIFKPKKLMESIYLKDLKKFELEYKNLTSIDFDKYRKNGERILHFLNLIDKDYQIRVYPIKNKSAILSFYKLPKFYEIEYSLFKKNLLFLGIYELGFYYKKFSQLDHHLIVGESGSGKSNFMQLLNINFLFNIDKINKLYMIDLKGGVELKRYNNMNKVEFVSDIQKLDLYLSDILIDLKNTQEEMLEKNIRKLNKFILLVFDEIGAISVYPDKKLRESIFDKLSLISMQGRASGILLFLFGQKIDNTILPSNIVNNLQTRILLKTSNDYNINIIDLKENIRERITTTEIQDFNKGRAIIKDGFSSEKNLIQFPFISDSFLNQSINLDFSKL
jgi:DNA segregation ATPase FtsK/SpoIIIE, S-DNA-T family